MCELEEVSETVYEVQTPVSSSNVDEALYDKLLNLHSPKVSVSTIGVKSMHIEQMVLFKKNGSS